MIKINDVELVDKDTLDAVLKKLLEKLDILNEEIDGLKKSIQTLDFKVQNPNQFNKIGKEPIKLSTISGKKEKSSIEKLLEEEDSSSTISKPIEQTTKPRKKYQRHNWNTIIEEYKKSDMKPSEFLHNKFGYNPDGSQIKRLVEG
ncbi:MAG: hypothetical protein ABIC57_04025 [bacterium]